MRKFILFFFVFMVVCLGFNAYAKVQNKKLPDYENWECKTGLIGGGASRILYFGKPDLVVEYKLVSKNYNDKELLIWVGIEFIKCNTVPQMVARFYFRGAEPIWKGPIQTTIIDMTKEKGNEVFLFSRDSEFGKLFVEFYKKIGFKEEDIKIPYVNIN